MNISQKPPLDPPKADDRDAVITDLKQRMAVKDATIRTLTTHNNAISAENANLRNLLSQAHEDVRRWKLYSILAGAASFFTGRVTR